MHRLYLVMYLHDHLKTAKRLSDKLLTHNFS